MWQYIIKRLLLMIPTLIGAAILIFFVLRLIPGDVCELKLAGAGLYADPEAIAGAMTIRSLKKFMIVCFALKPLPSNAPSCVSMRNVL